MKKKLPYIHPFLFALYPVIFLYSQNIHEYPENTLFVPSLLVLCFTALVFFITKLIIKRLDSTALITSAFVMLFFSYGRFIEATEKVAFSVGSVTITNTSIVLFSTILLFICIAFVIVRNKKNLVTLNKFCVVLAGILLFSPFFTIGQFEIKSGRIWSTKKEATVSTTKKVAPVKNAPDIYYFIFDRYAGTKSLENEYNFDNSTFLHFLKGKGFYIAENATTNYPKTFLSLGSSLNMEYLDYITAQTNGGASPDESLVTPLIRNSKVLQFLKSKGYTIVNIGPKTWGPTSKNPYADVNFIIQKGTYPFVDTFTTGFLNTTLAAPVLVNIFHDPTDVSKDPNNNEHRKIALFELYAVEQSIAIPGPKFVFAHILLPHDPFVFDKNCNPISEMVVKQHEHVYNYLNQLVCTNKKISKLVNDILAKSKVPPVIILQSDEGPFPMNEPIPPKQGWGSAKDQSLREKFPILNAYYFPNTPRTFLYPSITPVNSFRVLLNNYFNTSLPLLPDKNYVFQDEDNFYKFIDVTKRIKASE